MGSEGVGGISMMKVTVVAIQSPGACCIKPFVPLIKTAVVFFGFKRVLDQGPEQRE